MKVVQPQHTKIRKWVIPQKHLCNLLQNKNEKGLNGFEALKKCVREILVGFEESSILNYHLGYEPYIVFQEG
jgi:hypothetical protein